MKSLICIEGHDNGRRFLAISAFFYFILLISLPLLAKAGILVFLLLLLATPIMLASSLRRVYDAGFMTPFSGIPVVMFWLNTFGLVYIDHSAKWVLLIIAIVSTVIISTIRNIRVRHNHDYVLGYHGPVNTTNDSTITEIDRVEPTLAASSFDNLDSSALEKNHRQKIVKSSMEKPNQELTEYSFQAQLAHWFNENKKVALASLVGSLLLLILILVFASSPADEGQLSSENQPQEKAPENNKERLHKLEMPDSFWLMLDQNNAVTIGWEGDFKKDSSYWSSSTGKGDQTCSDLSFVLGEKIRTLDVTIKASEDYYADFSPVDTKAIIRSIADKDRFKLCGYEFVLKGTRALLRKHEHYRDYLN